MMASSLRLRLRTLRRHAGASAIMAAAIGLGIAAFTTSRATREPLAEDRLAHRTGLFHVELDTPEELTDRLDPQRYAPIERWFHTLLTYRDHLALSRIEGATAHAAGMGSRGVARAPGGEPITVSLHGLTSDIFSVFESRFRHGAPWTREADARAERVCVISEAANEALFGGGDSVGRHVALFGEDFTVAGVVERDLTRRAAPGADGRAIAMPFATAVALHVRPTIVLPPVEQVVSHDAFLASDALWIDTWIELDGEPSRRAFEARLAEHVAAEQARGRPLRGLTLVPRAEWWAQRPIDGGNALFELFCDVLLLTCTFLFGKLLLAMLEAQAKTTALLRACGASRRAVLLAHLSSAALLGIAGGLLGLVIAAIALAIINRLLPGRPVDYGLGPSSIARALGVSLAAAIVAGLYPAWHASRLSPAEAMRR